MKDQQQIIPKNTIKPKRVSPRKGRWSAQEKLKFKQGLAQYGKNWKKIQSYVKSRSLLQIRSHAQKFFIMQKKIDKRNKRWKKLGTKDTLLVKSEEKEEILTDSHTESGKRLNFVQIPTDCPNFVEPSSNDLVYSPLTYSTPSAYEYQQSTNIYCPMNFINPMMQMSIPITPSYPVSLNVPVPMMNVNMNMNIGVPMMNMTMNLNPYHNRNGQFVGYPMGGMQSNFVN